MIKARKRSCLRIGSGIHWCLVSPIGPIRPMRPIKAMGLMGLMELIQKTAKTAEWAGKPGFVVSDHFSGPAITRRL